MPEWYFSIVELLRDLRSKAWDAKASLAKDDVAAASLVNEYMKRDYQKLQEIWKAQGFPPQELGSLARHIRFGDEHDYDDMLRFDIEFIATNAEGQLRIAQPLSNSLGFERLLHPIVAASSLRHYREGDYRNAVLDGMVALSDLIRDRTRLPEDGKALATQAFSLGKPTP